MPLLELDDGSTVSESVVVARKVAELFAPQMLPAADAPLIDQLVDTWTKRVEPSYYGVLTAESESQSTYKTVLLLESLAAVDSLLWQRRMGAG